MVQRSVNLNDVKYQIQFIKKSKHVNDPIFANYNVLLSVYSFNIVCTKRQLHSIKE